MDEEIVLVFNRSQMRSAVSGDYPVVVTLEDTVLD